MKPFSKSNAYFNMHAFFILCLFALTWGWFILMLPIYLILEFIFWKALNKFEKSRFFAPIFIGILHYFILSALMSLVGVYVFDVDFDIKTIFEISFIMFVFMFINLVCANVAFIKE